LYAQEQAINTPSQPIPLPQIESSFPSCRNAATPSTRSSYILAMPRPTHEHHPQADHQKKNTVPRHRAEQARRMGLIPWMVSSTTGYPTMVCLPSHTHVVQPADYHLTAESGYMTTKTISTSRRIVEVHDHQKARHTDDEPRSSGATYEEYNRKTQQRKPRK
jgi:hypothetical protein